MNKDLLLFEELCCLQLNLDVEIVNLELHHFGV